MTNLEQECQKTGDNSTYRLNGPPKYTLWDTICYIKHPDGNKIDWSKNGLFDYEKNIFIIPAFGFLLALNELERSVVEMVGYEMKKLKK